MYTNVLYTHTYLQRNFRKILVTKNYALKDMCQMKTVPDVK
jgi:hypothetical protein